jgi:3'(2'), 5'-bisphosphate nucleotidase
MIPPDTLANVIRSVRDAGGLIMQIYARAEGFAVQRKADASPVTEADQRAESLLVAALKDITPDIPIVAEELAAAGCLPVVENRFWLVDPLDGTREFISRNGEFTVNVALIEAGRPVLGVVYAPALDALYAGTENAGAFIEDPSGTRPITVRSPPQEGLTVVSSRAHGDPEALQAFLGGYPIAEHRTAGSSLKICLIAAGEADLYPRFGRTMEWDTAAGHAVLAAAGGEVLDVHGGVLGYGKPGFENPHFIARGRFASVS